MALQEFSNRIATALKGSAMPLIVEPDGRACPGASLYTGARAIEKALLRSGFKPGSRIAFRGPKGIAFVQSMLGVLRAGMVFCPFDPNDPAAEGLIHQTDACLVLDERLVEFAFGQGLPSPRAGTVEREPGIRLWTSGSTGQRKAVTIPNRVLAQQVASHGPRLALGEKDTVLSYLPWNHAFGGVLELFCALCGKAEIRILGRFEPNGLARAILGADRPWLFTVPKALTALADAAEGPAALRRLCGGIVGGAPVDRRLCDILNAASVPLRVGYGQTECGPGVTLGEPGVFRPGYLGKPVGCLVRLTEGGEIAVEGPNVCLDEHSIRATGDLAEADGEGGYVFRGRCAGGWKWSNGRKFFPETLTSHLVDEVCLLKSTGDAAVVVGFEDSFQPPELPITVECVAIVPAAFREACRTATGKLSSVRTAAVVRRVLPHVPLDPLLYSATPDGQATEHDARAESASSR